MDDNPSSRAPRIDVRQGNAKERLPRVGPIEARRFLHLEGGARKMHLPICLFHSYVAQCRS